MLNEEVVHIWVKEALDEAKGSSIEYSTLTTLRSQCVGTLARRLSDGSILVNADRGCMGAMGHQHHNNLMLSLMAREALRYKKSGKQGYPRFVGVPFSAVHAALGHLHSIFEELALIDYREDRWDHSKKPPHHILGGVLLGVNHSTSRIIGMLDGTQKRSTYSLMLLSTPAVSFQHALLSLMPPTVQEATGYNPNYNMGIEALPFGRRSNWCRRCREGRPCTGHTSAKITRGVYPNAVRRQGEWFFIPAPDADAEDQKLLKETLHHQLLPPNASATRSHVATYSIQRDSDLLVKGQVRHLRGEHYMVYLPTWHRAYQNLALQSWSAMGRVD